MDQLVWVCAGIANLNKLLGYLSQKNINLSHFSKLSGMVRSRLSKSSPSVSNTPVEYIKVHFNVLTVTIIQRMVKIYIVM